MGMQQLGLQNAADESTELEQPSHPSDLKEDTSQAALGAELKTRGFSGSFTLASMTALAVIQVWLFAGQFLASQMLYGVDVANASVMQDVASLCSLAAVAAAILAKRVNLDTWLKVGGGLLAATVVLEAVIFPLAGAGASRGLLQALSAVFFIVNGLAFGCAFCNWVRLYVHSEEKIPLQIGLSLILSGVLSLALFLLPPLARTIALQLLPIVAILTLWHMVAVARKSGAVEFTEQTELSSYIKAPKKLWISLGMVGFVCGMSFGYVVADTERALSVIPWCNGIVIAMGIAIVVYFLATGKNPGFAIPTSVLLALTCVGQALISSFGEAFVPQTFAIEFAGLLLFEYVLLMQVPHVFRRIRTLRTFFALWLMLKGTQAVGMLLRLLLVGGVVNTPQRWVSAAVLCLAICVMAYALRDSSVTTAWEYFPFHHAPRRRYVEACTDVKDAYGLTPRELEILMLVGRGRNGTYVQERLVISKSTYQTHMRNLYKKMDIHSDQELIDLIECALDKRKTEEEKKAQ